MKEPAGNTDRAMKRGIECPGCGCHHLRVLFTRPSTGGRLRRRRQCRYCGRQLTTYEQVT